MTDSQKEKLLELFDKGMTIAKAAKQARVKYMRAYNFAVSIGYHGLGRTGPANKYYYTVYLNKDDSVIAHGTGQECTRQMGLERINQFYSIVSKSRSKRVKKYTVLVDDYAVVNY